MARLKLGEILIKQGIITEEQLNRAIEAQKTNKIKGYIGEVLIRLHIIKEEDIAFALGAQLGIPYYSSDNAELLIPKSDQSLDKLIPFTFAKKHSVLPLSQHLNSLTCAINDPLDLLLIDNMRRITGYEINLVIATKSAIDLAINNYYIKHNVKDDNNSMLDQAVESSYSYNDDSDTIIQKAPDNTAAELSLDKLIEKAEEAPVIKLVDLIIRQAIDERASDIHIEPFEEKIQIRYRIDGALIKIPPPAAHLHLPIISRIKILSKLDIAEKRLPQDGAIAAKLEDRTVDIRVSTVPTVWGEKVVMRILDKAAVPLELAGLGFDSKQVDTLRRGLATPHGLFFVTGPTGSGKSTTLYAALTETLDPRKNIMTVEDPVEFKVESINQISVRNEIGLTFATALKAFLRQDPDIIMVGEVRDLETASICVRAALTGHFVLSTLHTNDAASAITRLIDIGIPSYLITPSLIMILAQRLAKRLCPKCKEPYEPDIENQRGIKFNADLIYRAKGCEECNQSGYKGRMVLAEVLEVSDNIRRLIASNASANEIKDAARKEGMSTIFESGMRMVEKGQTSFEEICRVSTEE